MFFNSTIVEKKCSNKCKLFGVKCFAYVGPMGDWGILIIVQFHENKVMIPHSCLVSSVATIWRAIFMNISFMETDKNY